MKRWRPLSALMGRRTSADHRAEGFAELADQMTRLRSSRVSAGSGDVPSRAGQELDPLRCRLDSETTITGDGYSPRAGVEL